jgi:septal ring factor EnvC (AmiA/AmiB activator)
MIRRSRSMRYTATPGSTGSDTDALQTDVMRFMSIIGLCLMAVFALVQSMPPDEKDRIQPELEQQKLQQDIAYQQQRMQLLRADLRHLTTQMQSAQERNTRAQQALSSAQQQLTRLTDQTAQARRDRDRLTTELDVLRGQLAAGRNGLAGIQKTAQKKSHSLRQLQRQPGEQQKTPDTSDQRASTRKSEKRPPSLPASGKQGFTLRFASAGALHHLVATATVSLYAMAGKQAWRLSLRTGKPVFTPDTFPAWFHEMAASTVPVEYVGTLEKTKDPLTMSSVVWGVQLSSATKQGIAALTRELQGGVLVIAADGQVMLEAE